MEPGTQEMKLLKVILLKVLSPSLQQHNTHCVLIILISVDLSIHNYGSYSSNSNTSKAPFLVSLQKINTRILKYIYYTVLLPLHSLVQEMVELLPG